MKRQIFILLMCSALSFTVLADDHYTVDPRHTFPSFEINHLGFSIQRGFFNKTSGKIVLNPEAKTGRINIAIAAASINTGLKELEEILRSDDFLDAAQYPEITFVSDKLTFNKERLVAADGTLTLHGIAKLVHLTVERFYCGINIIALNTTCGANVTTTIKRSDFDVDKYAPKLGDEVRVAIQIEAIKD